MAFVTDGNIQVHLAEQDLAVCFRTGNAVNPLHRGHIAFRTDDVEAVKKRLEEKGVPYSDYGNWAMSGWYQIFFYDPDGNCIEIHQASGPQRKPDSASGRRDFERLSRGASQASLEKAILDRAGCSLR